MPKVQVNEEEIISEAVNNLCNNGEIDEVRRILTAHLSAFAVFCHEVGKKADYEEKTGNKIPTVRELTDAMANEAAEMGEMALEAMK